MEESNHTIKDSELACIEGELGSIIEELLGSIRGIIHRPGASGLDTLHSVVALRMQEKYEQTTPHIIKNRVRRILDIANLLIDEANRRRGYSHQASDRCPTTHLVELLTGCWLGLYFLGTPFPQPWEAVLFFVQRFGFPRGASASKAIGDIYRERRLTSPLAAGHAPEAIHVLDLNPLMISDKLHANNRNIKSSIAKIGRYYEFLQLRLYIRSGAPLKYCVPEWIVKNIIQDDTTREQRIREMWKLLNCCFNSGQILDAHPLATLRAVKKDFAIESLPACVLAPKKGVYRNVRQVLDGIGPPGNFLPGELLDNYRGRLIAAYNDAREISKNDEDVFRRLCVDLNEPV
jgi:hypothetical protein